MAVPCKARAGSGMPHPSARMPLPALKLSSSRRFHWPPLPPLLRLPPCRFETLPNIVLGGDSSGGLLALQMLAALTDPGWTGGANGSISIVAAAFTYAPLVSQSVSQSVGRSVSRSVGRSVVVAVTAARRAPLAGSLQRTLQRSSP
jgi:hypothetical protein